MLRVLRSIHVRTAAASALAAAIVFGTGWLWFRHTVYAGRMAAAEQKATADAETIAATTFPNTDAPPALSAATPAYLSTWVAVLDTGEIYCGGVVGADPFLRDHQLTLGFPTANGSFPRRVTARLGDQPG